MTDIALQPAAATAAAPIADEIGAAAAEAKAALDRAERDLAAARHACKRDAAELASAADALAAAGRQGALASDLAAASLRRLDAEAATLASRARLDAASRERDNKAATHKSASREAESASLTRRREMFWAKFAPAYEARCMEIVSAMAAEYRMARVVKQAFSQEDQRVRIRQLLTTKRFLESLSLPCLRERDYVLRGRTQRDMRHYWWPGNEIENLDDILPCEGVSLDASEFGSPFRRPDDLSNIEDKIKRIESRLVVLYMDAASTIFELLKEEWLIRRDTAAFRKAPPEGRPLDILAVNVALPSPKGGEMIWDPKWSASYRFRDLP